MPPSRVSRVPWLYAYRRTGTYPAATERSGKWMVFVPIYDVDRAWAVIKDATEKGSLGDGSKCSTMWENAHATDRETKVICVYTYDGGDLADVRRVRAELRALGFTRPMGWKADATTLAGVYSSPGQRVSRYWE